MTRRSLSAFGLMVVLLITAVAFGAARGQARVAGQMVLCVGSAAITVSVDRDGQPVRSVHMCPDCALGSLAAPNLPDAELIVPVLSRSEVLRRTELATVAALWRSRAKVRGPPAFPA